jgi:hypothetical protein
VFLLCCPYASRARRRLALHQHALSRLFGVSVQPVVVIRESPVPDREAALKLSISLYCSEEKQVLGQHG